jgi:hypothetical protein
MASDWCFALVVAGAVTGRRVDQLTTEIGDHLAGYVDDLTRRASSGASGFNTKPVHPRALGVWLTAHTDLHIIDIPGPVTAGSARIRGHGPAGGPTLWATVTFDGAGRVSALDMDDNGP